MSESATSNLARTIRVAARWLVLAVLATVAMIYFANPSGAEDPSASWEAEPRETEGSNALVAVVRGPADDPEQIVPSLVLTCGNGIWSLNYDAGLDDAGYAEWLSRSAIFDFDFGNSIIQASLVFEAMDAVFAAPLTNTDPLLEALVAGTAVAISTSEPDFPASTFTLSGSAAAVREVAAACA